MKIRPAVVLSAFVFFVATFSISNLLAQTSDIETAGAEQARFEKETHLEEQTRLDQTKTAAPDYVEDKEQKKVEEADSSVRFVLKEITLSGNTNIPSEEFEPYVLTYLNQEVSLNDLKELARKIKQHYRSQGFIAAYVYLPPQDVTSGSVEMIVIEGTVGEIHIEGNKWYSTRVINRMLNLTAKNVLYYRDLRGALSFLNKNRDIDAKAVLKPGAEPKTTDVVISIKDKFPVHLSADINNLGTTNTGKHRLGFSVSHNNLFGQMDQLTSRFQFGKGIWAIGADYNIPINRHRTRVGFSFSHASVDVGGDFKALDVEGRATTYGVYILQPIIYGGAIESTLNLGFDWKSVENKVLGEVSGQDELRILNIGINTEMTDRWGRTLSPHSLHFGFDTFLGASSKVDGGSSRALTGGQFFIYRGSLIRYQRLPKDMVLAIRGVAQLSPDRLPPIEQLRLGGAFGVRGYQEGEYLADNGAFVTNEVLVPTYFFPAEWKLPYAQKPLRQQLQGVAFFDFGGGGVRHELAGETDSRFLAGAGGGLRANLFDKVYARFHWAAPLGSDPNDGANGQFYFGISAEVM